MRIGGLASGIDTDSIIKDLMRAERMPLNKMEQDRTRLEWQRDAYREMNTMLTELDDMAFDLKLSSNFQAKSFHSSQENAVTARGGANASDGSYSIRVDQLATSAMNISQATMDINEDLSTFAGDQYFYTMDEDGNVQVHEFTVNAGDTVRDVIDRINNDRESDVRLFYDDMTKKVVMETTRTGNYNPEKKIRLDEANNLDIDGIKINRNYDSVTVKGKTIAIDEENNNLIISKDLPPEELKPEDKLEINFSNKDIAINGKTISYDGKTLTITDGENVVELDKGNARDIDGVDFSLSNNGTFTVNGFEVDLDERKLFLEDQTAIGQHGDQLLVGGLAVGLNQPDAVTVNGKQVSWNEGGTLTLDKMDSPGEQNTYDLSEGRTVELGGKEIVFGAGNSFFHKVLQLDPNKESGGQNAIAYYNNDYEVTSTDNNYTINGITFEFRAETTENVTINVQNGIDETVEKITEFVDKYNEIIEKMNEKLREPKHRDFPPLTKEQREEMEEREIELWEEKAKSGLLRGDSILQSALTQLRQNWYQRVDTGGTFNYLSEIGIRTTNDYMDGGKLEINEEELREALETDYDSVFALFSNDAEDESRGILHRLEDVLGPGNTEKGVVWQIRERAGGTTDVALESYTLGKRMQDVDDRMEAFEDRLQRIEDRYWRQFGEMEKAISIMNQQSMMLMSSFMPQ